MHGIKIPQQDFVLKMQGGLMHGDGGGGGGGRICGTLWYYVGVTLRRQNMLANIPCHLLYTWHACAIRVYNKV